MSPRRIHLLGGPDAASIRLMDADTGKLIEGVVKVELLMVPGEGALVNITQSCILMGVNMVAVDAGQPLIDLPDDHPEVVAAAPLMSQLSEPTKEVLLDMAYLLGANDRAEAEACVAQPPKVVELPPVKRRKRRAFDQLVDELRQPTADPAPPPLPDAPSEKGRRAPPPEDPPEVEEPEPDLSADDKAELAQLLAKAAAPAPGEALQRQQIAQTPWPFPSMSLKGGR